MLLKNFLHPIFSHLPLSISLLMLATLCWVALKKAALPSWYAALHYALAGGLTLAFMTGWFAQDSASQSFTISEDIIAQHFSYARIALCGSSISIGSLYVIPLTASKRQHTIATILHFIATVITISFVIIASHAGGTLVYHHGAGVSLL